MTTGTSHRSKPTRTAAGAALAAVLLAATACGASADGDPEPDHRSFALSGTLLTIETDNADLTVTAADVHQVEVERRIQVWKAGGSEPRITWAMNGSTLTFKVDCGWGVGSCSVRHLVQVPRAVAVTVQDGNGDVTASGFTTPLHITSTNGDIKASGSTGPLTLGTTNGDIHATDLRAAQTTATATNGDINLSYAAAPDGVRATSTTGEVAVDLPDGPTGYRLDLHTGVGDIHRGGVPDTAGSPRTVAVTTVTGDITLLRTGG